MASKHSKKIRKAVSLACYVGYNVVIYPLMFRGFDDVRYRYALAVWIALGVAYAIWWLYENIYLVSRCHRIYDAYRQFAKNFSLVEAEVEDFFGDPITYSRAEVFMLVRQDWFQKKSKKLKISLEPLVSPAQLNGECN